MIHVCVDAGHGGTDPGTVHSGVKEKDLTLVYSRLLTGAVLRRGMSAVETRKKDELPTLHERCVIANDENADLFVSCHFNSGPPARFGLWVLYASGSTRGRQLAETIYRAIYPAGELNVFADMTEATGLRRLAVLHGTTMPAVIMEYGFLSSPVDRAKLLDVVVADRLIEGTVAGISTYAKAVGLY